MQRQGSPFAILSFITLLYYSRADNLEIQGDFYTQFQLRTYISAQQTYAVPVLPVGTDT